MITARPYISALLVAVLVLTSHAMAQARSMTNAAGEIVLCTGKGPISVPVDAEGKPTGPPHICPDCALALFADITPPFSTPSAVGLPGERLRFAYNAERAPHNPRAASARGPPALL